MGQRTTKTVTISLPPQMVEALDRLRGQEHRTRSELLREALRHYMINAERMRAIPVADPEPGEAEAMARGKAVIDRGAFVTLDDLPHDLG